MERTEDGTSICKQRKLSENGLVSSHENFENTQESGNTEEYSNSMFSQETQAYSPQLTTEPDNEEEQNNDVTSISIGEEDVPKMNKLKSVMEDAKFIGDILNNIDVSDIYDKLKAIRQNADRIEIVTNQLLENNTKQKTVEKSTSNVFMQDFVRIIDLTTTNMSALPVSAEEIQDLLNSAQTRPNRVDHVFSQILGLYCLKRQGHGDLVKDMKTVLVQCPWVSFDEVSKMMIKKKTSPDRTKQILDLFLPKANDLQRTDSALSNTSLANDELYKDTRIIAKVMPEIDRNEIYAYLEAHHHEKNRIHIVIEELMKIKSNGESLSSFDVTTDEAIPSHKPSKGIFNIQDEVDELRQIFPDCDPNYLFEQLEQKADDKERMKTVAMAMFENKNYLKLKEREEREKKISTRNRIKNLKFDMEEFIQKFPEPVTFFENDERKMNENYLKHVEIQIRNDFPQLKGKYIKKILDKHKSHYSTTRKEIQADVADGQCKYKM